MGAFDEISPVLLILASKCNHDSVKSLPMMSILSKKINKLVSQGVRTKRNYNILLSWVTISSIPLSLNVFGLITLLSIISIEFFTDSNTRAPIFNIINNLSYNCLAGYVFYILTVHIPFQYKKVKLNNYVNNKAVYLLVQVDNLFKTLIEYSNFKKEFDTLTMPNIDSIFKTLTLDEIEEMLRTTNPFNIVHSQFEFKSFPDWIDYWKCKQSNVKIAINELFMHSDVLSPEMIKYITWIEFQFTRMDYIINVFESNKNNDTLHLFGASFEYLLKYKRKFSKVFHEDFGIALFRLHSFEFINDDKDD